MRIQVHLHGILRDKLSAELKGKTAVTLNDGAVIQDLLDELGVQGHLQTAVNDQLIDNCQTLLKAGDRVDIFRPAAGGLWR